VKSRGREEARRGEAIRQGRVRREGSAGESVKLVRRRQPQDNRSRSSGRGLVEAWKGDNPIGKESAVGLIDLRHSRLIRSRAVGPTTIA
jgi:hypothetical protein